MKKEMRPPSQNASASQRKGEIVIYQTHDKKVRIDVKLNQETIWLSLNQIAEVFGTNKSGISRHIKNIYESGELYKDSTVAKIATVQIEGKRRIERNIEYYNLDAVLSIGYRVNSKQATQFRIWATKTLKDYLVKGYVIDKKRLLEAQNKFKELQTTVDFLQKKSGHKLLQGQEQEILSLLGDYSKTLTLLEQYDTEKVIVLLPAGNSVHIEAGIAHGLGKQLILIGEPEKPETLYLIFKERHKTIEDFLKTIL